MNKMFILTTIFSVGLSVVLTNPVPQNSGVNQGSRFTNRGPGFLNIGIPPVFNNPSKELLRNVFYNLNSGLIGAGIPVAPSSNPSASQIDVVQPVPTPTEAGATIVNAGNVPLSIPDAPSQISTAITDGVSTPTSQVEVVQPVPTPTEAGTTIVNAGNNVPVAIPDVPPQISAAIIDGVSTPTSQVEVSQPAPGIPSNQGMGIETVENVNPVVQSVVNPTASPIGSVIPVAITPIAGVAPSSAVPQAQSAESTMQPIAPPPKQEFGTETTADVIPVGQSVANPSPNQFAGFIKPIDHSSLLNQHFKLIQNLLNVASNGANAGTFNVNADGVPRATSDIGSSNTSGGGSRQGTQSSTADEIVKSVETIGNVGSVRN